MRKEKARNYTEHPNRSYLSDYQIRLTSPLEMSFLVDQAYQQAQITRQLIRVLGMSIRSIS